VKGGLAYSDNCTIDDEPGKRIENDSKFLEICCAIVAGDENTVLSAFYGFHSGVNDLNYYFGPTLLGFSIVRGSPDMLRLCFAPYVPQLDNVSIFPYSLRQPGIKIPRPW
jgi:hypothetical protein